MGGHPNLRIASLNPIKTSYQLIGMRKMPLYAFPIS